MKLMMKLIDEPNLKPIILMIHDDVFRACREQREHILFMKEKSWSTSFCSIFKENLPSNLFSTCISVAAMLDVNRVALRPSSPWARLPVLWLVPYLRWRFCLGGYANFLSEVESRWNESMGLPRLLNNSGVPKDVQLIFISSVKDSAKPLNTLWRHIDVSYFFFILN